MRLGVLAVIRPTFDVDAATAVVVRARDALSREGHELIGNTQPAIGDDEARAAAAVIAAHDQTVDAVVVLQGTFTTSVGVGVLATRFDAPVVVWSFPEPSDGGGHLRLNSLCGGTLASYTLHRLGVDVRPVHGDPDDHHVIDRLRLALTEHPRRPDPERPPRDDLPARTVDAAASVIDRLRDARIGRIGDPPEGFEPCGYDAEQLRRHLGVTVDERSLDELFSLAASAPTPVVLATRAEASESAVGVEQLDPHGVEQSARLLAGMREVVGRHGWDAVSTRCWPECLVGFGGAVCWPSARLADDGVPAGCEADVLGSVTGLVLQHLTGRPAFLADLVAVDQATDTATLWHCGVAAASLARTDRPVRVADHPNRGVPIVHDFGLAPGAITVARLSHRPSGRLALVIGRAEILDADAHLHGTSAVVRFDHPVGEVLDRVLGDGLDHHVSIAYGDVADELEAFARLSGIDVIDL